MTDLPPVFSKLLNLNGWADADIAQITSDWSPRQYWRLARGDARALLMHSVDPHFRGHTLDDFVRLNAVYRDMGLNVPMIYAVDMDAGLLLIEDFGSITIEHPAHEAEGYTAAIDALAVMRRADTTHLPDFRDGYIFKKLEMYSADAGWMQAWQAVWDALPPCPFVFAHMDYKAGNLHWMPARDGFERLGILDYQTAQTAPFVYDIVNLLEDARRNVPADLKAALKARFKAALPDAWQGAFDAWYVVTAAQFHAMILGQMRQNGKGDAGIQARLEAYFQDEIQAEALAPVRAWIAGNHET